MILLGCLLAYSAAVAPRFILVLAWLFSDRWPRVWQGDWIMPLLGIIFLPYTTIMYLLAWSPTIGGGGTIEGWDWMWILMGLFLDFMKWTQVIANRKQAMAVTQQYYPSGAPRSPSGPASSAAVGAALSSGQVPVSTSPTAVDHDVAPSATDPMATAATQATEDRE
jgi:hypothetical protein